MNERDIVALCLIVRKKKFERSRAIIARCEKNVEQSKKDFLDAKEKQDEFKRNAPQMQDQLFDEIRGKPLNYLELDTYFAELAEIAVADITLGEGAFALEKAVESAKTELDKHLLALREIRKKYEKMQKIEETILAEHALESIIEDDDNMDDIALTLSQSRFQTNV